MTSRELERHWHEWDDQDYRIVVTGCLAGLADEEVARGAGRTLRALEQRAHVLLAPGNGNGNGSAWRRLRQLLDRDPGYDWETVVRAYHADNDLPYFDQAVDDRLREVWAQTAPRPRAWLRPRRTAGTGMRDLETELGLHEFLIARRLRYLGVADSLAEIVERLGASPEGALAARVRLMQDRQAIALHVLTLTDEAGAVLHTSLHPNHAEAEKARDELAAEEHSLTTWTIVERWLGDGDTGPVPVTGSFGTLATAPAADTDRPGRRRTAPVLPPELPSFMRLPHPPPRRREEPPADPAV
ncbi:hypothetical protein ACFVMC_32905 [Nocardia sp. NPDC127579]|uniref:hypothetical protein n=1 Tax=Nocardia sp. NPDC127579 TaxID=3345402 RepID=UPI00364273B1